MQFQERWPNECSLRNANLAAPTQSGPFAGKFMDTAGSESLQDERDRERRRNGRRPFCVGLGDIAGVRCNTIAGRTPAGIHTGTSSGTTLVRLYEAQEEAARRVAQRLHDDSAQMLAVVYFELAEITQDCPEATAGKIRGVVNLLDEVREQLRGLSHELRPPILDHMGLVPALRYLANGLGKRSGLEIVVPDSPVEIPPSLQVVLYRAVQEALFNVARHARATRAEVSLRVEHACVHCVVSDNGIGFTMPRNGSAAVTGLGLVGIYERISALGGDCTIVSCRRKGTQFTELQMVIPL